MSRPTLSIIIVNWNTHDLLARCLESVRDNIQTFERSNIETFVVDNASTDGSAAMVRECFPWVQLIENRGNVGFARANNQAIHQSRGRYVLLLNPDTEVVPGALQTLVRFMDEHPDAGAAGARLLNPDGSLQPSCHPFPTLFREFWRLFHLDALHPLARYPMETWATDIARPVAVVQGAAMIIRREVLAQVGLLDEQYYIYSEEVDLCHRIRHAPIPSTKTNSSSNNSHQNTSWRIYWVPQARVIHYGGQSTQQMPGPMFLRLYQGKILYFRKRHGPLAARLYKGILLLASLARLLLTPLAWLERPPQRHRHLALAGRYGQLLKALRSY